MVTRKSSHQPRTDRKGVLYKCPIVVDSRQRAYRKVLPLVAHATNEHADFASRRNARFVGARVAEDKPTEQVHWDFTSKPIKRYRVEFDTNYE